MQNTPIYLDNAATTPILPEVIEEMVLVMKNNFGNPSSTHQFGRKTKSKIENCRKEIASSLACEAKNIIFTSSGTEANNLAIRSSYAFGIRNFISSSLEHKCVLETLDALKKTDSSVNIFWLSPDEKGNLDLLSLEEILSKSDKCFISLMHANNEVGNVYDIKEISKIAKKYDAIFHSDMVQTIGHYPISFSEYDVDFASCSAHKFHGPKGIGFLYAKSLSMVQPEITGGGQERNNRSGTENVAGIIGMTKALSISVKKYKQNRNYILGLKKYALSQLKKQFKDVKFNGLSSDIEASLYTIISFQFKKINLLSFELDLRNIAISQGSACSSGAAIGSSVINSLYNEEVDEATIRLSFSHFNTKAEIDIFINALKELY